MWLRTCLWLVALLALASGALAQDSQQFSVPPPILTINQDRLVSETIRGARIASELEAQVAALADENAEIESQLVAQEQELTERRETLTPDEFRALADAFDLEVQRIRAEQDEKAREINVLRENARQTFLNEAALVISEIVRERGALVVLDRRDVFLSADSIDITDEAIRRINGSQNE